MDTSEDYIKMCEKAREVQELNPCSARTPLKFEEGNWYATHVYHQSRYSIYVAKYDYIVAGAIWLPRQGQLQDMVSPPYGKCFDVWVACNDWWHLPETNVGYCKSMEQLWLAFVQKELHNKTWNGKDWV